MMRKIFDSIIMQNGLESFLGEKKNPRNFRELRNVLGLFMRTKTIIIIDVKIFYDVETWSQRRRILK